MALSALERLRLAIADRPRVALREQVGLGDGLRTTFQTQLSPLEEASETVLINEVPTSGYAIHYPTGVLEFTNPPLSAEVILITYRWTAFSNAELGDLLDRFDLRRAAIQALEWLLADSERFMKYTFGQESVDRGAAREGLLKLLERLESQTGSGAVVLVQADTAEQRALLHPFQGEVGYDQWAAG